MIQTFRLIQNINKNSVKTCVNFEGKYLLKNRSNLIHRNNIGFDLLKSGTLQLVLDPRLQDNCDAVDLNWYEKLGNLNIHNQINYRTGSHYQTMTSIGDLPHLYIYEHLHIDLRNAMDDTLTASLNVSIGPTFPIDTFVYKSRTKEVNEWLDWMRTNYLLIREAK